LSVSKAQDRCSAGFLIPATLELAALMRPNFAEEPTP